MNGWIKMNDLVSALATDYNEVYEKELSEHPDMLRRRSIVVEAMIHDKGMTREDAERSYDEDAVESIREDHLRSTIFPSEES